MAYRRSLPAGQPQDRWQAVPMFQPEHLRLVSDHTLFRCAEQLRWFLTVAREEEDFRKVDDVRQIELYLEAMEEELQTRSVDTPRT